MIHSKNFYIWMVYVIIVFSSLFVNLSAQTINEYTVKKTDPVIVIDGMLTEEQWKAAALTESFVIYHSGDSTNLNTQAKFLWDDAYLYVGFICEDPDVWGILENRDDYLWNGEVVEILCDPDDDGLNYFEVQVNPLETMLDLFLDKAYYAGGQADFGWDLDSLKAAVWVDGTLNNLNSLDIQWICEIALPFHELAFMAPSLHFPPVNGESWRMLVTRYDYQRTGDEIVEISSWNQTDDRGFHVPEKFGRITFSDENIISSLSEETDSVHPLKFGFGTIYPNPFNPKTIINYKLPITNYVRLEIYNITGQKVSTLVSEKQSPGYYQVEWDASGYASGIYFLKILSEQAVEVRKITLLR